MFKPLEIASAVILLIWLFCLFAQVVASAVHGHAAAYRLAIGAAACLIALTVLNAYAAFVGSLVTMHVVLMSITALFAWLHLRSAARHRNR